MRSVLSPEHALIYVMVVVSASDANMSDRELHVIGEMVKTLQAFRSFDANNLLGVARDCAALLREPEGFDAVLSLVREALTPRQRETAYALALEVALADTTVASEEIRAVERIRHALEIDRLVAAAIERGATARNRFS